MQLIPSFQLEELQYSKYTEPLNFDASLQKPTEREALGAQEEGNQHLYTGVHESQG